MSKNQSSLPPWGTGVLTPLVNKYMRQLEQITETITKLDLKIKESRTEIQELLNKKDWIAPEIARGEEKRVKIALQVERARLWKTFFMLLRRDISKIDHMQDDWASKSRLEIELWVIKQAIVRLEAQENTIDTTVVEKKKYITRTEWEIEEYRTKEQVIANTLEEIQETIAGFDSMLQLSWSLSEEKSLRNREETATTVIVQIQKLMKFLYEKISGYGYTLTDQTKIKKDQDELVLKFYKDAVAELYKKLFTSPDWIVAQTTRNADFITLDGEGVWKKDVQYEQREWLRKKLCTTIEKCFEQYELYKAFCDGLIDRDIISPLSTFDTWNKRHLSSLKWVSEIFRRYPQVYALVKGSHIKMLYAKVDEKLDDLKSKTWYKNFEPFLISLKEWLPDELYALLFRHIIKKYKTYEIIQNWHPNRLSTEWYIYYWNGEDRMGEKEYISRIWEMVHELQRALFCADYHNSNTMKWWWNKMINLLLWNIAETNLSAYDGQWRKRENKWQTVIQTAEKTLNNLIPTVSLPQEVIADE